MLEIYKLMTKEVKDMLNGDNTTLVFGVESCPNCGMGEGKQSPINNSTVFTAEKLFAAQTTTTSNNVVSNERQLS